MIFPEIMPLEIEMISGAYTPLLPIHRTGWRNLPFYVLVNQQGVRGRIQIRDLDYILEDGFSYLMPRNVPHKLTWIDGPAPVSIWCHFNICLFHTVDYLSFFEIPPSFSAELSAKLKSKTLELVRPENSDPLSDALKVHRLAGELAELVISGCREREGARLRLSQLDHLRPALEYIRKHAGRGFSLKTAAKVMNLSLSRFSAVFTEQTGTSPYAYRNKVRLEQAYAMIRTQGILPKEAAFELGFCDVFHFSRMFSREFGITPSALLRSLRNGGAGF